MDADDPRAKWHPIDQTALAFITSNSSAPGVVYPLGTNALPTQIQPMRNVASYYVSHYSSVRTLDNNLLAGGEMAVVRTEGEQARAYNYLIATSTNGQVFFNGPHKNSPLHTKQRRRG